MDVIQCFPCITRMTKISPLWNGWVIWILQALLDHGQLISAGVHLGPKYHWAQNQY